MNEHILGLRDGDKWVRSFSKWAMCVFAGRETREKCAALKEKWQMHPAIFGFNPHPIWTK